MNNFVDAIVGNDGVARTFNGAATHATSGKALVDYFFLAGASRGKNITHVFAAAYQDNKELALRALLWTRDVRGGAGERKQFRDLLLHLERIDPAALTLILPRVPELGRWDDLLIFTGEGRKPAFELIRRGLFDPVFASQRGLVAKWMPRKGDVAVALRSFLNMSPRRYRKYLVANSNVVESQMCAKNWEGINYDHVPSVASARYRKAFWRNDEARYKEYIETLKKEQAAPASEPKTRKINAQAIFPYDVIKTLSYRYSPTKNDIDAAQVQWNALPDFVGQGSFMPLIDVSGSMGSEVSKGLRAMDIAVSLGLYVAERNKSVFKDTFLVFSSHPSMGHLSGGINNRIQKMSHCVHMGSTNLEAAFKAILDHAKKNDVPQADMPQFLLIISDMEFNSTCRGGMNYDIARHHFEAAGYNLPTVVFWNLNGRSGNSPVEYTQSGTILVSGFSPAIMKNVLSNKRATPLDTVLDTLMNERYRLAS